MGEIVQVVVIAGLWVVAFVEVLRVVRGAGTGSFLVAVVGLAVVQTLSHERLVVAIGEIREVVVVRHTASLVIAVALVRFARSVTARRLVVTTPVWVALAVALGAPLLVPGGALPVPDHARALVYVSSPWWLVHWGAYLAALAIVVAVGVDFSVRGARVSRGPLRLRLCLLVAGLVLTGVHAVVKLAHLSVLLSDRTADPSAVTAVERGSALAAGIVFVVALLMGSVGSLAVGATERWQVWVLWRVWADLWDHAPHLELERHGRLRSTLALDPRMTLVRFVVEIGDAIRVLGPHLPEHDDADLAERAAALQAAGGRRERGEVSHHDVDLSQHEGTLGQRVRELRDLARAW